MFLFVDRLVGLSWVAVSAFCVGLLFDVLDCCVVVVVLS